MELSDVRASLRRHWAVALLVVALIPAAMAIYLVRRDVVRPPARYTTSADILIPARSDEVDETVEDVPPVLLQGQTELALDRDTKDAALEGAGLDPASPPKASFSAKLNEDQDIMMLSVSAPSRELADTLLDSYIVAYGEGRRQSVLDAAVELQETERRVIGILQQTITYVEKGMEGLDVPLPLRVPDGEGVYTPPGTPNEGILLAYQRNALLNELQRRQVNYSNQATRATIPGDYTTTVQRRRTSRITPPPPSPLIPLLEILGVGLLLAVAIPFGMDRLDPTITEARAAPGALRSGLLETIPHMPRRLQRRLAPPGSTWELAFRSLAATSLSTDRLPKAIIVTSPAETTQDAVAANFAAGLAGLGVRVALVGTVPRQDWFLREVDDAEASDEQEAVEVGQPVGGLPQPVAAAGAGRAVSTFPELLEDAQAGQLGGDLLERLGQRELANLYIVPPGDDDAELSLDGLPPLLAALASSGIDITVIAAPGLLDDPNATIMAWSTRHVLWAVELGQVNRSDAHLAADRLELAGVEPFGIALVKRRALRT